MTSQTYPPLDITPVWARLNDSIVRLIDYVPEDKLNWSPRPELWNFRGILLHIAGARQGWMGSDIGDNDPAPSVYQWARSKDDMRRALRETWQRVGRFLAEASKLDREYHREDAGETYTGHWVAFHLLEHDIHHRADIFHYLALLGIETPEVGTP